MTRALAIVIWSLQTIAVFYHVRAILYKQYLKRKNIKQLLKVEDVVKVTIESQEVDLEFHIKTKNSKMAVKADSSNNKLNDEDKPGHYFLQPLYSTFASLDELHQIMANTYKDFDGPLLKLPIQKDTICAVPKGNNWYRGQVTLTYEKNSSSGVRLVDFFGEYLTVSSYKLRQIRSDFMTLPFQASDILLASGKSNEHKYIN